MENIIFAILLSIIQGISEWLPISSSGHLALFQNLFGEVDLTYDIFLHFASIFAVLVIFSKDILNLFNFKKKENLKYLGFLIIATIPAVIVALVFRNLIEASFSNIIFLGIFFMISGLIIFLTKFVRIKKDKITWRDSIFIGIFQALAIFPGVSRSGLTISSGMYKGIKKEQVIKFSFFLAVIIIIGASILELPNLDLNQISYTVLIVSFILTFLVSIVTIKFLLKIIRTNKFWIFGIYNLLLGLFILIWKAIISFI
jgi:undecaprenyl-diphosphatase